MKLLNPSTRFSAILTMAIVAAVCGVLPATLHAANQKAAVAQRAFASPEEAIKALREATQAKDKAALNEIFGPDANLLLTGDEVQDANNSARFAKALAESCQQVPEADGKITLEVGTNNWPFPIPLVNTNSRWLFDTDAGKQEIINRHIGKDELHAIGVCGAYVDAQRQYATLNANGSGTVKYALKFKSTPGTKDGLYWEATTGEAASPFGPLVAEAHAEGYGHNRQGSGPHSFHGYFFRILARQGKDAPGGKVNYMSHGYLTKGFALVAWPEHWDQSGIMTFIVNQDGKIYQRNLGEKTAQLAQSMKEYNPDSQWTLVQDEGVRNAVLEK
jgi:type II secretory pathway pseudopilin PulG